MIVNERFNPNLSLSFLLFKIQRSLVVFSYNKVEYRDEIYLLRIRLIRWCDKPLWTDVGFFYLIKHSLNFNFNKKISTNGKRETYK